MYVVILYAVKFSIQFPIFVVSVGDLTWSTTCVQDYINQINSNLFQYKQAILRSEKLKYMTKLWCTNFSTNDLYDHTRHNEVKFTP